MRKISKSILVLGLLTPIFLWGHGDKKHVDNNTTTKVETSIKEEVKVETLSLINEAYAKEVKAIFSNKCFDCHGEINSFPWYYKIPGIKQLMDYDMKEAKKHLDMSKDFPFVSHESPLEDLKSLKEVIEENDMPPIQYVLGHWDSRLTEDEKKEVFAWIDTSLKTLGETK
jgi:glycyl-tRNA synthetase (class II)